MRCSGCFDNSSRMTIKMPYDNKSRTRNNFVNNGKAIAEVIKKWDKNSDEWMSEKQRNNEGWQVASYKKEAQNTINFWK